MKLTEVKFEHLSEVTYRIYLCECASGNNPKVSLLVIEFQGTHGIGSEGNNDSLFMATIVKAALEIWHAHGLVLDFSRLAYEWGDTIGHVLLAGKSSRGRKFPTAVVVSDICKPALESASPFYATEPETGNEPKWLFDDLESAILYVKEKVNLSRQPFASNK